MLKKSLEMKFEYLDKFGFNYNEATQKIEDRLKTLYTSDSQYTKQLLDIMLKLFKTPGNWGQDWFELMWISDYSYRYGGVPKDFHDILGFLDFMHMLIYDTIDDGEIYILKTETYNRFYKYTKDSNWEPSDWLYGFRIYNRYPYDYEKLGMAVLPKILRNQEVMIDNDWYKTEAIKLSLTYVSFENFIKIVERIIDRSTRKYNAIQNYLKDNNIDYRTFSNDMNHCCKFDDEFPNLIGYADYTDLFTNWKVLIYDKINYSLIKNLTPEKN